MSGVLDRIETADAAMSEAATDRLRSYDAVARRAALPRKRRMLSEMIADREITLLTPFTGTTGCGDALFFCRAVRMLLAISGDCHVTLKTEPQFQRLFAANFAPVSVTTAEMHEPLFHETPLPNWDRGIPLRDLLDIVRSAEIADPMPYLFADPDLVAHYRKLVPPDAVGLCWAATGGRQDTRSIPLQSLSPLWARGAPCVSLQAGCERHQIDGTPVIDILPPEPDWIETAAVAACLSTIVSVDGAVAHIASALGCGLYLVGFHAFTVHPRVISEWLPTVHDLRRPDVAQLLATEITRTRGEKLSLPTDRAALQPNETMLRDEIWKRY